MIASHNALNRWMLSVMLSSTRKIARAPRACASECRQSTRRIDHMWKLRPRISMIEQKLQSYVQPRDVSTMSIGRPIIV